MALPDISAWRVETLRFTFFFAEPPAGRDANWWRTIVGAEPEAVTSKPQVGEHYEIGPYMDGQLELKIAFNRLDLLLTYPFAAMPSAKNGHSLQELLDKFLPRLVEWKAQVGTPIVRVAFGAIGVHMVDSIASGNRLLKSFMPYLDVDPGQVQDLILQINHPRESNVLVGAKLNLIKKFGVLTGQFMELALGGLPKLSVSYAVRGEFDFSTPADREQPINVDALTGIFSEFADGALSYLKEGA